MYRVELVNISKSFGGIMALKNVTLKVRAGEIHALVGENGAGKSTLMKILSGAYLRDSGRILIDNHEVQIQNTHDSKKLGIGIIYQEFSLIPDLSVAENIYLHQLGGKGFWMKWKNIFGKTDALLQSIGFQIDPSLKVKHLSVAYQQIVEIAKALSEKLKILILDEPSTVIGPYEIQKLFDSLKRLKDEGVAIIYISHHLGEIFQIADRISVLKDGRASDSMQVSETDKDSIINLMLGRSLNAMFPPRKAVLGKELMRVKSLNFKDKVQNVSLSIKAGEILGIAGLVGSGRTETARIIFGADKMDSGKVYLQDKLLRVNSPQKAYKAGIGMVPEDRKQHGVILSLSVKHNLSLMILREITGILGFIKQKKENSLTDKLIARLSVKLMDLKTEVGRLSGGNQQKVSIAKWLSRENKILIIDEPTRGIDIGAKVEIYSLLHDLAAKGVGIMMISSETTELMGMCDRIIVMRKGKVCGEFEKKDFSEENILRLAIGA
jgi:ribose transport system ATP-binding protein